MSKKEVEQKIRQVMNDEFDRETPTLLRILENIFPDAIEGIGQQDLIPAYVLNLFSARLMLEAYPSSQLVDLARGLFLFHIRFFDPYYSEKSVAVVFKAVQEGDPSLVRRLHAHFVEYCRMGGVEPISEINLSKWMTTQAGSVDERTAERIRVEELPGALRGRQGLISGIPGSGKSTLMRRIAYLDAAYEDNGQCVYYLSARYIHYADETEEAAILIYAL